MSRINAFNKTHQDAIDFIEECKNSEFEELRLLTNFLLETDSNPYALFGDDGNCMGTAETFAGVLRLFGHALYDDGELCFPVVNGEPRIRFVSKQDAINNPRMFVLTEQERQMDAPGTSYRQFSGIPDNQSIFEVSVITDVKEFIATLEASQAADLQRCFMDDAEDYGLNVALAHHQHKRLFNRGWVLDFLKSDHVSDC